MPVGRAVSVVRFGRPPAIRKPLPISPKTRLPQPPVKIVTREIAPCRLEDHYYSTLQDDLMYLTYTHELGPRPPPRQIRLTYDPNNPYSKYRYNPPVGGSQLGRKSPPPCTAENVVQLEKVQIHIMNKEAIANRSQLLGTIMALRSLTGETEKGGGQHAIDGVQVVRGKKQVGGWIRKGIPVGAKVTLKGPAMYDFIGSLVEFVLPRIREFQGVELPPPSANTETPAAVSGVVSFGLPPSAMAFFPQIEVNQDAYPKMYGMHIHFVTNATGVGAQDRARALVSGFQIPFVRKS
ncbi:60s ribosomal protein l7 [Dendrothele bispora CBS 962.96]|uniref:60s ribosomal protein l7 n=1 Tax=Dendrothele bispora (strain CBS 962.96) TaxID=1314807 RepID=A0A4S8MJ20_DENBC|nr:60s ribosomal protein l7 [Dendrothele bispora CBS 962.96]